MNEGTKFEGKPFALKDMLNMVFCFMNDPHCFGLSWTFIRFIFELEKIPQTVVCPLPTVCENNA